MIYKLAVIYSWLYGFFKDHFGIHIRGLGFILRRVTKDTVLVVHGKKLYFDHVMAEAYAMPLIGKWNEPETHNFIKLIQNSMRINFVEVGANIGEFLVDIASNANCISALAFEPNPLACTVIKQNLDLNKLQNVIVLEKALAQQAGKVPMFFGAHSPTSSLLSIESKAGHGVEVVVSTLDTELFESNLDKNIPLVLLIDVEGYELNVVKGGGGSYCTIQASRYI